MQTFDTNLVSALIGLFGALLGGVIARFVIRWLETEEREREGAFSALLGLALAYELIQSYPTGSPSISELDKLESLRKDAVQLLIMAAAKVHEDLRGDLYLLGMLIQRRLSKVVPTEVRKKSMRTRIESMEKRIKKSYLGTGHVWKELAMTLEEFFEAFIKKT